MKKLVNKVALVTGASKGIGAAVARHLAAEGAAVIVNYASSREGAERVVADITAQGGRAVAIQANLAEPAQATRLFEQAREAFGPLDLLVNNAGVYEFAPLEAITPEHFHRQFDLNVLGLLLSSQEALKSFRPEGGNIINVSSVVSTHVLANTAVYSATKAAVDAITRILAKELGDRNIRVNSVNPGLIDTEGAAHIVRGESRPEGRVGQPDDIARAVVFLAAEDSGWITGETLKLAGAVL